MISNTWKAYRKVWILKKLGNEDRTRTWNRTMIRSDSQRAADICSLEWLHSSPGSPAGTAWPPWPGSRRPLWTARGWLPRCPWSPLGPPSPKHWPPTGRTPRAVKGRDMVLSERQTETVICRPPPDQKFSCIWEVLETYSLPDVQKTPEWCLTSFYLVCRGSSQKSVFVANPRYSPKGYFCVQYLRGLIQ